MLVEREKDKKPLTDRTIDTYDYVINKLINIDIYETLIPIFSDKEITRDNPFFSSYNISAKEGLTSDEYKTISYMGQFFKEKVKYNPKEIVRYLNFIGYKEVKKEDVFILCIKDDQTTIDEETCNVYRDFVEVGKKHPSAIAFEDYTQIANIDKYPIVEHRVHSIASYPKVVQTSIKHSTLMSDAVVTKVKHIANYVPTVETSTKHQTDNEYIDGFDKYFGLGDTK